MELRAELTVSLEHCYVGRGEIIWGIFVQAILCISLRNIQAICKWGSRGEFTHVNEGRAVTGDSMVTVSSLVEFPPPKI